VGDLGAGHGRAVVERRLSTLRRVPAIVIPYRGDAKRRLPSPLRAAFAVAMLGDVVAAAAPLGHVLVVTDDASVVPAGAAIVPDPGGGLGAAVAAGLAEVHGHALVVNADLPRATTAALERLAAAGLALVEAADGTTNALSLPDPSVFEPLYGSGSAERFRALAPFATVSIPELEVDVDSDADLQRLGAGVGPRTRALLAVPA
jgi:2-phospho-L-lactate/phosphoenolpyruvate guanylyltransferase